MLPGCRRRALSTCSPFGPPWAPAPIVPKLNSVIEDGNQDVATHAGRAELANDPLEDVLFVLKVRSMGQYHSVINPASFSPPHLDFCEGSGVKASFKIMMEGARDGPARPEEQEGGLIAPFNPSRGAARRGPPVPTDPEQQPCARMRTAACVCAHGARARFLAVYGASCLPPGTGGQGDRMTDDETGKLLHKHEHNDFPSASRGSRSLLLSVVQSSSS